MIHLIPGPHPTSRDISKALIKSNMQPKKWAIKRNDCNKCEVNAWANNHRNEDTCKYESANGWIHSESISGYNLSLFGMSRHPSFTEITIEQFREITNPTKSNTMTPKEKEQLLESLWYKRNPTHEENADHGRDMFWGTVLAVINDYNQATGEITQGKGEPERLPFKYPVPDGMEVVTRDGRKVEQLTKFECDHPYCVIGVVSGELETFTIDGYLTKSNISVKATSNIDLFLRPEPPEMVTAWVNYYEDGLVAIHKSKEDADKGTSAGRIGPAIKIQFPKPKGI